MLALECSSLDNQELTAQRLISVRFQIRETIKEMCLGRKDQRNRSHCLSLQVWCQTVWQSLHATADLPLFLCQCGASNQAFNCLSPLFTSLLLFLSSSYVRWMSSFSVKGISFPASHHSIKSGGVRSGGRQTKVWGSNTFPLEKLWLPVCPFLPFSCSSYLPH